MFLLSHKGSPLRQSLGKGIWVDEVELARGATVKDACRKLAITEHTYYRRQDGISSTSVGTDCARATTGCFEVAPS